ncbi:Serine/threonine-protein kinase RsbT [Variovorax sp. PBS-H4]|nr:Serine/threonine-protein kinase RsbT [Variovorax sp. PBS-H4]
MEDASRVGEARRHAAQLAAGMGWSELDAGRLALVITELGTNLQRHAHQGRLLIAARPQASEVEILGIDEGPGIPDIALAMRDGHSSGSTPGTGLGAVKRVADAFEIHSTMPEGTVSVARVRAAGSRRETVRPGPGSILIGAVCLPAPGETVSGDAWAAAATDADCNAVLLADGLGHGPEAAKASLAATASFAQAPAAELHATLERVHQALQTTRGGAVCVARVDAAASTLTFTGAGNISGRIVSGVFDKAFITQHGTAGIRIRKPEVTSAELPPHAVVILHSDGIETRWSAERIRPLLQRDPTLVACVLLRDHTRHRDDATVVVLRRKE